MTWLISAPPKAKRRSQDRRPPNAIKKTGPGLVSAREPDTSPVRLLPLPSDGWSYKMTKMDARGADHVQIQHRRGQEPFLRAGAAGAARRGGDHRQGQQAVAQAR